MLLRLSDKLVDRWSLTPGNDDRPVRPFPYTWNLTALEAGMNAPVILGTEEFTLFTVVLSRGWESPFGEFLGDFENRVGRLLEDVRFPGRLKLKAFTITKLTDQRLIKFGNHLATTVRGIHGLADALC